LSFNETETCKKSGGYEFDVIHPETALPVDRREVEPPDRGQTETMIRSYFRLPVWAPDQCIPREIEILTVNA
jgi:hypothetical protein